MNASGSLAAFAHTAQLVRKPSAGRSDRPIERFFCYQINLVHSVDQLHEIVKLGLGDEGSEVQILSLRPKIQLNPQLAGPNADRTRRLYRRARKRPGPESRPSISSARLPVRQTALAAAGLGPSVRRGLRLRKRSCHEHGKHKRSGNES
jgi:hypothetical protein